MPSRPNFEERERSPKLNRPRPCPKHRSDPKHLWHKIPLTPSPPASFFNDKKMSDDFHKRVEESIQNPQNMGEMTDADAIGTVGSPGCGDMVRMWLKYKVENGEKIIDKATFQSFGCETAIAAASLATELIRGKTPEQAANMSGAELAADLGPLPPTKIHCTQLVEDALRSALSGQAAEAPQSAQPQAEPSSLIDSLNTDRPKESGVKLVFLDSEESKE